MVKVSLPIVWFDARYALKDGVLSPPTKDTSILFKTPASDINSSSVESGADANSVCAEITSVFNFVPVTAPVVSWELPTLPEDGAFVCPTMFK